MSSLNSSEFRYYFIFVMVFITLYILYFSIGFPYQKKRLSVEFAIISRGNTQNSLNADLNYRVLIIFWMSPPTEHVKSLYYIVLHYIILHIRCNMQRWPANIPY